MSIESLNNYKRLRQESRPTRWLGISLYIGVIVVNAYYISAGIGTCQADSTWQTGGLLILAMFGFWFIDEFEFKRFGANPPLYAGMTLIILRLVLLQFIPFIDCTGFHRFLYLVIPLLAYLYYGRKLGILSAVVAYIFFAIDFYGARCGCLAAFNDEIFLSYSLIVLLGMVFVSIMAEVLRYEKKSRTQAEGLYSELQQSQKQLAELARVNERNRIARDIHDSLGHHLTAVSIQLEKAKAFQKIDANEASKALDSAKRSTTEALQDVRKSVGSLRENSRGVANEVSVSQSELVSEQPTLLDTSQAFSLFDSVTELLKGYKEIKVDYDFSGNESAFSQPVLMALYRIVQEGLTNIRKHAKATQVKIDLDLDHLDHVAKLMLEDNGVGFDVSETPEQHYGLQGLQERVELVGGRLNIVSELGQGTQIAVTIPKQGLKTTS